MTPQMRLTEVDGIEIVEHIDDKMPPGCEQAYPLGGCYQQNAGRHHIWYSVVSMPYVRRHEVAHAKGMRHSHWVSYGGESCSTVLVGADGYLPGQRLCIGSRGEYVQGYDSTIYSGLGVAPVPRN